MSTPANNLQLHLPGMHCASCVSRIEEALTSVEGLTHSTNLGTRQARIGYESAEALKRALKALEKTGYPAASETRTLAIEGMHCASCVHRIETELEHMPEVLDSNINLASNRARLEVVEGADLAPAIAAIRRAGYDAREVVQQAHGEQSREQRESASLKKRLVVSALLTLPIFVLEMSGHALPGLAAWLDANIGREMLHWIFMVLAAGAMSISSLFVLGNALRLRRD